MSRFVTCLLPLIVGGILSTEAMAGPHAVGVHVGWGHHGYCGRPFGYGGRYWGHWGRPYCYRPYGGAWGFGVATAPVYVGGYGYYGPPPVVEEHPPGPPVEVAHWNDADLIEMALNKFAVTRGLDRGNNQIVAEIVNKDYHDETGALAKVKFRVHWVMWRTVYKDGHEIHEEKHKSTTVKLKFDEVGEFTDFDD